MGARHLQVRSIVQGFVLTDLQAYGFQMPAVARGAFKCVRRAEIARTSRATLDRSLRPKQSISETLGPRAEEVNYNRIALVPSKWR